MKAFWDQRYLEDHYAYGTAPNEFFKSYIDNHEPGRVLLPGEGQGRNAVYAATKGWQVDAFDYSESGRKRALELAQKMGVTIQYFLADLEHLEFLSTHYDLIGLIFVHVPSAIRQSIHRNLSRHLEPGGTMLLEVFSQEQLHYQSGGPKNVDMLYSEDDLREDFKFLTIEQLEKTEVSLEEGPYHRGTASVIRMIARR